MMKYADQEVGRQVLDFLATYEIEPGQGADIEGMERAVADDRKALSALVTRMYVERSMTEAEGDAARAALQDRINAREKALRGAQAAAERSKVPNVPMGDREALQAWWDGATIEAQADVLRWAVQRVVILPGKRGGKAGFDRSRVVVWMAFGAAAEAASTAA
jgi:hypothetical protein